MPTRLTNLRLKRISIVDDGDNPDANIMLIKRRNTNDNIKKELDAMADNDKLTDEQRAEIAAEAVAKAKAAHDVELQEVQKELDALKLAKAADASDVEKRIAKAEADAKETRETLVKIMDSKADADAVAKVKEWGNIPGVTDDVAAVVKAVRKSAPGMAEKYEALLDGANKMIGEGSLLKSIGGDGDGSGGTAIAKIQAKANELRAANPDMTDAVAMEKAMELNPDLMKQHNREFDITPTKNPHYEGRG